MLDLLQQTCTRGGERWADWFDFLSRLLVVEPRYSNIPDALDAATDRVTGWDAVASRCKTRAVALVNVGRMLQALNEFHEATLNWFHGDTLHNSLQAMLLISYI